MAFAFEVISTKLTSIYTIDASDTVYLDKDGAVTSSTTAFFGNNDGEMHLVIHGAVASQSTTISLGSTATSTSALTVLIGETGTVDSLVDNTGVYIVRTGAVIINHGQISADYRGIVFGYGAVDGTVLNTGKIVAQASSAIFVVGEFSSVSGTFDIHNSGLLSGLSGVWIRNQSLELFNSGTIDGKDSGVYITSNSGDTNTLSVNNTGTIRSSDGEAITGAEAADSVINSGRITGDIDLGAGDDTFVGNGGVVEGSIIGGSGNDVLDLRGASVNGTVFGGQDNDTYFVSDGTLVLIEAEAEGTDTVKSKTGWTLGDNFENLTLIGGKNINGIGNSVSNTLTGNSGNNTLRGKVGQDTIHGGDGDDRLFGGTGFDTLNGDDGADILSGGRGNDTLNGGGDADTLRGGLNEDTINGGDGKDILIGGLGRDLLTGGNGKDDFVFNRKGDSLRGNQSDAITDFTIGEDRVDLSGMQPDLTYIGSSGFSGTKGEVQVTIVGGTNSMFKVDVDGDGAWDMRVVVQGVTTLSEADFIL